MLKQYEYNGLVFQFEEGEQPAGAVEVKRGSKADKAAKPSDKAAKAANKGK